MSTPANEMRQAAQPAFTQGIHYFAAERSEHDHLAQSAVIAEGKAAIDNIDAAAIYQTLLAADALRYLTLQVCSSKESGHPGGFASSAGSYNCSSLSNCS